MANQISPLAYVHPDAKIGEDNIIGPFVILTKTLLSEMVMFCKTVSL